MAGILFNFIGYVSRFIPQTVHHVHQHGVPLPSTIHAVITKELLDKFPEILVIGDVHGCYDELVETIEIAEKDTKDKVLKIFVGDLVDKGEKHREVLSYLMKEGKDDCFAVRGNHDDSAIKEYVRRQKDPSYELTRPWVADLTEDEINFLKGLPYTLTLEGFNILIVHAGLVPGLPLQRNKPHDMVTMRNIIMDENGELIPTSSNKEGEAWASLWRGPQHIYFGHDSRRKFQQHQYATGLDTGCVYGGCLTSIFIKGPREGEIIKVDAKKIYKPPGS